MAESGHEHGKMDITDHEKTFNSFMRFTTNAAIGILIFLVFLYLIAG
jgi:hypothetical protein